LTKRYFKRNRTLDQEILQHMKGRKLSQEIRFEGIGVHGHVGRPKNKRR
jgi:hypothetical protein